MDLSFLRAICHKSSLLVTIKILSPDWIKISCLPKLFGSLCLCYVKIGLLLLFMELNIPIGHYVVVSHVFLLDSLACLTLHLQCGSVSEIKDGCMDDLLVSRLALVFSQEQRSDGPSYRRY